MKQSFIAIVSALILLTGSQCMAQMATDAPAKDTTVPKIEFGLKLGVNLKTTSGDTWDKEYKAGVTAGVTVGVHKNKIGVHGDVLINSTSYSSKFITDTFGNKDNLKALYISIPVLFEYYVIPALKIQVGPQFANIISMKSDRGIGAPKVYFKNSEFSGVLGLEAKLPAKLSIGARYIMGFSNVNSKVLINTEKWQNSTILIYAGYQIQ